MNNFFDAIGIDLGILVVMLMVLVLVLIVQIFQELGMFIANKTDKRIRN